MNGPSSLPVSSPNLELGLIGNCTFNALVDGAGAVVWCCMPRPDGDPVLHALLGTTGAGATGRFAVEITDRHVVALYQRLSACQEVDPKPSDRSKWPRAHPHFAPRFTDRGRTFRPLLLVRRITPVRGRPTIRRAAATGV